MVRWLGLQSFSRKYNLRKTRGVGGGGVVNLTPSAFLGLKKVFKKQQMFFI